MFAKLMAVIVSIGVVACVLLAVRQQRVQAAHEMAEVQRRVLLQDRTLWQLRAEIAACTMPATVAAAAHRYGDLSFNNPERYKDMVRRESESMVTTAAAER